MTKNDHQDDTADADEKRREECSKLWNVAREGFSRLVEEAPAAWNGSDARFYRTEKQTITQHLDPFYWGGVVTLFLFGTFRISGSRWYARFYETYLSRQQSKQLPKSDFKQRSTTQQREWKSYLDHKAEQKTELASEVVRLPTDILVSLMCGASSVALLSNPTQLKKDFAEAPLVSGKSMIYECICSDMEKAYDPTVNPGDDDTLRTLQMFARNCRRRSNYIGTREREGVARPDVVPYPGLDGERRGRSI